MRQLLLNPEARILTCAPSNTAMDMIAEKLMVHGESQLFRLNLLLRDPECLRTGLKSYSLKNNNIFAFLPLEELWKYCIIFNMYIHQCALVHQISQGPFHAHFH